MTFVAEYKIKIHSKEDYEDDAPSTENLFGELGDIIDGVLEEFIRNNPGYTFELTD